MQGTNEDREYCFYAVELMFGSKSPFLHEYPFVVESLREKKLEFVETIISGKVYGRSLCFNTQKGKERGINVESIRGSGISIFMFYFDLKYKLRIKDIMFNSEEYDRIKDSKRYLKSKIKTFGRLIKILHKKEIDQAPLLINEYPEICKFMLENPQYWNSLII